MKAYRLFIIVLLPLAFAYICFGHTNHKYKNAQLLQAAWKGNYELANDLLRSGANSNTVDANGATPLIWTAIENKPKVAELLIKFGANVNAKTINGDTALHWAAVMGNERIVSILLAAKADTNVTESRIGATPLMAAAAKGRDGVAKLLVAHAATINTLDKNGKSALDYAALNGSSATTALLVTNGAGFQGIKPKTIATAFIHLGPSDQPTLLELFQMNLSDSQGIQQSASGLVLDLTDQLDEESNFPYAIYYGPGLMDSSFHTL